MTETGRHSRAEPGGAGSRSGQPRRREGNV